MGAFLVVINRMWSATCFIINYIGIKVLITDIVICGTNEHESTMLSDVRETGICCVVIVIVGDAPELYVLIFSCPPLGLDSLL